MHYIFLFILKLYIIKNNLLHIIYKKENMVKMKKIVIIFIMVFLVGCTQNKNCPEIVKDYLKEYQNLSSNVTKNLNKVIDENIEFNEAHKALYKKILLRQYQSLKFDILSEEYDSNKALIKVNINVIDLKKAEEDAVQDLSKNLKDFYNEKNEFDNEKYISHKLNLMMDESSRIDYEIIFYLHKEKGKWVLEQPNDDDLSKIHGIY